MYRISKAQVHYYAVRVVRRLPFITSHESEDSRQRVEKSGKLYKKKDQRNKVLVNKKPLTTNN